MLMGADLGWVSFDDGSQMEKIIPFSVKTRIFEFQHLVRSTSCPMNWDICARGNLRLFWERAA